MKKIACLLSCLSVTLVLSAQAVDTSFHAYEQLIPGTEVKFKLQPIPAGRFSMGSAAKDRWKETDELPQHSVTISAFWMGACEVTFDEFNLFFNDIAISQNIPTDAVTRPSSPYIDLTLGMGKAGGFPANSMQQYGALMYCKWLYNKTGVFFRLPTEAEWEYACRAGSATVFFFGNDTAALDDYAWYTHNSNGHYHKVGLKKPNAWGLYDMLGNVGEWVLDQYQPDYYTSQDATDPVREPKTKFPRTVRGGSYQDGAMEMRNANRVESDLAWNRRDPQIPKSRWWNADAPFVGFRVVRPLKQPAPEEAAAFFERYIGL